LSQYDDEMARWEDCDFEMAEGRAPGSAAIAFGDEPPGPHARATAGALGTWTITLTAGPGGIAEGGGFALSGPHMGFKFDFRPHSTHPRRLAYTTAETDGQCRLELTVDSRDPMHRYEIAKVIVRDGGLRQGESITLRVGDRRAGSPGAVVISTVDRGVNIRVWADNDGSGAFRLIEGSPLLVSVVPDTTPYRYVVTLPSYAGVGEEMTLGLVAFDRCGNLVEDCTETVRFDAPGLTGLPDSYTFLESDAGVAELPGVQAKAPGVLRVRVADRRDAEGTSNPCRVSKAEPKLRLFWGDIHAHAYDASELSDLTPTSDPEYNLRYGRDVARLQFCALASHIWPGQEEAAGRWWPLAREAASKLDEPGRYIPFLAHEWRGDTGDRNSLFPSLDADVVNPPRDRVELLHRGTLKQGGMVIPHVGGAIADWKAHDPLSERQAELASGHGNFEWFLQEALSAGARVGVHCSSDGHAFAPGAPRRVEVWGGRHWQLTRRDAGYAGASLAAVWAKRLTREDIWRAFWERHSFGTTGARMIIDARVNGGPMGREIRADGPVTFEVDASGTAPIASIAIVRNDRRLAIHRPRALDARWTFVDENPPAGTSAYYVRVVQIDDEVGWTSPVWVENALGAPDADDLLPPWDTPDEEEPTDNNAAEVLPRLLEYLMREEDPLRFSAITPVRMVDWPNAPYALFHAYDNRRGRAVRIRFFVDFPEGRIRLDAGLPPFGVMRY